MSFLLENLSKATTKRFPDRNYQFDDIQITKDCQRSSEKIFKTSGKIEKRRYTLRINKHTFKT
jgi:hypothetical protein